MNTHAHDAAASMNYLPLSKADPHLPALVVLGAQSIGIRAGTAFAGRKFENLTKLPAPASGYHPGCDYGVTVDGDELALVDLTEAPIGNKYLGGFHYAPGGNAAARAGGDANPCINPLSLWDVNFRPRCRDPRGMTLVETDRIKKFWCDIYLLGADHIEQGTSRFGVRIADGDDPPQRPEGRCERFDYEAACAVMTYHGKDLLGIEEFFAAAYGVTELTACGRDPEITKLDAPRTSKFGLMQATGNLWIWCHDGDPDRPRASFAGGSWHVGGCAGSRCATVGSWPGHSSGDLGARGRCDHLQLD